MHCKRPQLCFNTGPRRWSWWRSISKSAYRTLNIRFTYWWRNSKREKKASDPHWHESSWSIELYWTWVTRQAIREQCCSPSATFKQRHEHNFLFHSWIFPQLIRGISSLHAGHHTNVLRGVICIGSGSDVPQRDKLIGPGWVLKWNSEFEKKSIQLRALHGSVLAGLLDWSRGAGL